jgi:HEAT repeat protein
MRERVLAASLAVGLLAAAGAADEPKQFGKPLSYWDKALHDRKSPDHKMAPHALSKIGYPALPVLRKALVDPDVNVRQGAAFGLVKMGPVAEPALPELTAALKDQNDQVRQLAAGAVGGIGRRAGAAVSGLIEMLGAATVSTKLAAVRALGQIGPPARQAVPQLTKLASDPAPLVAKAAKESLDKIKGS